ncbi:undecaprenyl-phosphate glucose phosphotransferase [Amphritea sp. 2_MG-2023]|uniref:undecaprenyl-phosphate glucose phosphotransferase n=1 Tax=Amphritea TaxID=515417 RepID=UPI001C06DEF7|nr:MULTISPECIES: undecaprenyl-phosphate glucose phosphotransferase [Amphritea]MBU2964345.1 undecaprenyl-phosphate glucose phosphotransferase [Amphritea atlantica]MDO6419695.1 undecaprenyl-phosphate glucose phosphotransferase [Amphritea sp. 2_MG-2023]
MNIKVTPYGTVARKRRLLNNHESLGFWVQHFVDLVIVCGTLFFFTFIKVGAIPTNYRLLAVVALFCVWIIYRRRGVYRQSLGFYKSAFRLLSAWVHVLLLLALVGFVTKSGDSFSREVLIEWAVVGYVLQLISMNLLGTLHKRYNEMFSREIPTLVLGTGDLANKLVQNLNSNDWLPDRVLGFVQSDDISLSEHDSTSLPLPLLGSISGLRQLIIENHIRRIYVALPIAESKTIEALHINLLDMNVDVIWVPDIFSLSLLNHSIREVAGMPLISLNESPMTSRRSQIVIKNILDKVLAALALIAFSPLMLVIAVLIKRESEGPVFFKQERHGFDGKIIKVWKFRSMRLHDDTEVKQATKGDSRVTKVGAFIRRTSIDELPQFINVLQGTMSLVGPRPHAVAHNNYYSDKVNAYLARHRIKPGITGLAQISGFRGETDTLDKMEKRVEFDLAYINNWSLSLDLKILIKTPISLISKDIY